MTGAPVMGSASVRAGARVRDGMPHRQREGVQAPSAEPACRPLMAGVHRVQRRCYYDVIVLHARRYDVIILGSTVYKHDSRADRRL